MGHNIDLCFLLNLPEKVKCKNCNNKIGSGFEEYDIDCGKPEASANNGFLTLETYCSICEHTSEYKFEVKLVKSI